MGTIIIAIVVLWSTLGPFIKMRVDRENEILGIFLPWKKWILLWIVSGPAWWFLAIITGIVAGIVGAIGCIYVALMEYFTNDGTREYGIGRRI